MFKINKSYTTVSIPIQLYNTVRLIIKSSPRYTSISEFVKEAIREKIERNLEVDKALRTRLREFQQ